MSEDEIKNKVTSDTMAVFKAKEKSILIDPEYYKKYSEYLKDKYGEKVYKLPINLPITCPNRIQNTGCTFCSEVGTGFEAMSSSCSVTQQLQSTKELITRKYKAKKFIAYFQNFTNTYDSLENLKLKYDSVFIDKRIIGLQIATRPDCINENIVRLLKTYTDKYYVCVELGLQTSNDNTALTINRGYESKVFTEAVKLLNKYNIEVITHIMVGLPGETIDNIKETVEFLNNHNIQGLKIHSCYVIKNTKLAKLYQDGNYSPISLDEYLEYASYIITHINPKIILHKVSGDAPKDLLIAPEWNSHKKWILNGLDKLLNDKNLYQGMYYKA